MSTDPLIAPQSLILLEGQGRGGELGGGWAPSVVHRALAGCCLPSSPVSPPSRGSCPPVAPSPPGQPRTLLGAKTCPLVIEHTLKPIQVTFSFLSVTARLSTGHGKSRQRPEVRLAQPSKSPTPRASHLAQELVGNAGSPAAPRPAESGYLSGEGSGILCNLDACWSLGALLSTCCSQTA